MAIIRTFEGELFHHKVLWRAALTLSERAAAEPTGDFYLYVSASVMAFASIEAYANFLLDVLDTKTFADQRNIFRQCGVMGKLDFVGNLVGRNSPVPDDQLLVVRQLKGFRDSMMHAKPERYAGQADAPDGENLPHFEPREIDRWATSERWTEVRRSIEGYANDLHGLARVKGAHDITKSEPILARLSPEALTGGMRWETGELAAR
jgi:hypothetical protein